MLLTSEIFERVQDKASGGLRSFRMVEAAKWPIKIILKIKI